MAFNLKKTSQLENAPAEAVDIANDQAERSKESLDQLKSGVPVLENPKTPDQGEPPQLSPTVENVARNLAAVDTMRQLQLMLDQIKSIDASAAGQLMGDARYQQLMWQVANFNPESYGLTPEQMSQAKSAAPSIQNFGPLVQRFRAIADQLQKTEQEKTNLQRQQPIPPSMNKVLFNLKRHKTAQVNQPDAPNENKKATFISKYLDRLLSYDGRKGQNDVVSQQAVEEIKKMASPILENDINDALERIQSVTNRELATKHLEDVYDNFVAPSCGGQNQMEPVMSENKPKGLIKFNLSDQVLNNRKDLEKTAADQFGQQYVLFGPEEKRICPKLRGKNCGDVVSEYVCRHHCLDGIVIDDTRTICGEALWRANVMDKFSREYVDKDGKIVGGYINKRFEINRNVPEENRMRLKPGETRKPRPPEWGNLESRMQAMRAKEGEKRNYRPETDKTQPFDWAKDVDKNTMKDVRTSGETFKGKDPEPVKEAQTKKAFNLSRMQKDALSESDPFDWTSQYHQVVADLVSAHPELQTEIDEFRDDPQTLLSFLMSQPGTSYDPNVQRLGMLIQGKSQGQTKTARGFNSNYWEDQYGGEAPPPVQIPSKYKIDPEELRRRRMVNQQGDRIEDRQNRMFDKMQGFKGMEAPQAKEMPGPDWERDKYDFAAGEAKWQAASDEELQHALKDLNEVIEIWEKALRDGTGSNPKLGYYHDERHTVLQEMKRRGISGKSLAAPSPVDDGTPIEPVESPIRAALSSAWWMKEAQVPQAVGADEALNHPVQNNPDDVESRKYWFDKLIATAHTPEQLEKIRVKAEQFFANDPAQMQEIHAKVQQRTQQLAEGGDQASWMQRQKWNLTNLMAQTDDSKKKI